jgi:hypothetical protein
MRAIRGGYERAPLLAVMRPRHIEALELLPVAS